MSQQALKIAHAEAWEAHEAKKAAAPRSESPSKKPENRRRAQTMDELKAELEALINERLGGSGPSGGEKGRLKIAQSQGMKALLRSAKNEEALKGHEDRITMLEEALMRGYDPEARTLRSLKARWAAYLAEA